VVIVNRTSPSSHTRGHRGVLFYAEALLAHYAALGIPVVNPVAAYRFEKSKALQLGLFERVGARYPRSIVVNHPSQALGVLDRLRFPIVVKPNVGGSGAGIVRVDSKEELEAALDRLELGPDGTALVQEFIEPAEGAIVRIEVLGGEYLYAIRIVRAQDAGFNLCPADICQPGAPTPASADLGACPVSPTAGLTVTRFDPPAEAIETVIRLARAASIDVGGVEYLVGKADRRIYYYDVNATSNFVANAEAVVGFDPTARFADYIVRRALERREPAAA
jgi:glutathione synthase/RimK-type ligase-like ATP-grasp enzyme